MTTAKLVRIGFRLAVVIGACVAGFYIGRPLYWKVSATLQEIREKDYTQEAVKQGRNRRLEHTNGRNLSSSFSLQVHRRLQLDLHVINDLLPRLYGERGFNDLMAEAQRSVGWGPGSTIRFEQERALKKAQREKEIELARPKRKTTKPSTKDTLLTNEPTKEVSTTKESLKEESKSASKSSRRLLLL